MKLLSVAKIRELEKQADANGLSYPEMMTQAATGLAKIINSRYDQKKSDYEVIGLAGPGNNGGDTLVALRLLQGEGWRTRAITFFRNKKEDPLLDEYLSAGGTILPYVEETPSAQNLMPAIIIDGILGTGTSLPIRPRMRKVLDEISRQFSPQKFIRVAVDCPSGMDCDTGKVDGLVLQADLTICMAGVKQGLIQPEALPLVGELITVPIGFDEYLPDWSVGMNDVVGSLDVARMLPERDASGHKGTFGSVCVIGGSQNYIGAPVLAGKAAYRTGCGLVQLAVPESIYPIMAGSFLEAIWLPLPHSDGAIAPSAASIIKQSSGKVDCYVLGPGIGMGIGVTEFIENLLMDTRAVHPSGESQLTIVNSKWVIDADALKALAKIDDWWQKFPMECVLTPHPGEMSVLTGMSVKEIQSNRIEICEQFAHKWGKIVVLKGAGTVVSHPDGRVAIVPMMTSALAHAGTGDVLAGMIASLIAQGVAEFDACLAGCWCHARAGQIAAQRKGSPASVLATDVIECLGDVWREFWKPESRQV